MERAESWAWFREGGGAKPTTGDVGFASPGKASKKLPWKGIPASASKSGNSI